MNPRIKPRMNPRIKPGMNPGTDPARRGRPLQGKSAEKPQGSKTRPALQAGLKPGVYEDNGSPWRRVLPDSEEGTRVLVARR